ncbi:serine/threonine dehydratase [Flexivirga endophytica]|uniref:threonine ammonia-lyase n=1 Tax=Flexivirga endophytica TaxID=1849103 RepID=A0A916WTL5_9MICO|nr:threo-3-hydroxy-L-aspartate ammonia-lyase [Flexivirga endophytica]GGB28704.1 serine/threonine dehydratase [Flexivirga endophytica]GHB62381.1 serine/threonine dehydratase [Flexivirga endophytica]
MSAVELADVQDAARALDGVAHRTAVVTSSRLDSELGIELHLKCENLQRMGAFKFRGAYNALSRLDDEARAAGVVAFSSGNHAQAVALAARLLGIPATIVMPTDAPQIKLAATKGYGAEVVPYDRRTEDRAAIAAELAERDGRTVIPPFNHPHIVAGQGTAALELLQDVPDLDAVIAPLGGGGLLSGTAVATRGMRPQASVFGAEPAAGDDGKQSFDAGRIVQIPVPDTLADGAQTTALGELTFAIIQELVEDIVRVTDDELVEAMRTLAHTCKLVVEPTGALALAAARTLAPTMPGAKVGVILSGGNVDLDRYAGLISAG